jgi:hypothetical protein
MGFTIPGAPFDARLLRIFDVGHAVHDMLQRQFISAGMVPSIPWPVGRVLTSVNADFSTVSHAIPAGYPGHAVEVPIEDEEYKLRGTLDVIFDLKGAKFVGEIKTKHSGSFAKMQDAQEAWCPPTFSPSRLGRMWLALWIIQAESQSSLRSSMRSSLSLSAGSAAFVTCPAGRSAVMPLPPAPNTP